jgi:hypothetical protein
VSFLITQSPKQAMRKEFGRPDIFSRTANQRRQSVESLSALINNTIEGFHRHIWVVNDDLVATGNQSVPCYGGEYIERHTHLASVLAGVVVKLGYDLLARFQVDLWGDVLWTTGGESSMTLMLVFRRLSRRQRVNAFRAALEAEYAGRVAAGTTARWLPVLFSSEYFPQ